MKRNSFTLMIRLGKGEHLPTWFVAKGSTDAKALVRKVKWKVNALFLIECGAPGRSRTRDLLITSQLLYQLSYKGMAGVIATSFALVQLPARINHFSFF
jgi:hypothetical protein